MMRREHSSFPSKWTREFRCAIKLSHLHLAIYAYLENAPESHMTGIYFITPAAIAEMVCADRGLVVQAMADLEEARLIHWDQASDVVWIPCVCAEQFRWKRGSGSESDYRTVNAKKHLAHLPPTPLLEKFLSNWPVFAGGES